MSAFDPVADDANEVPSALGQHNASHAPATERDPQMKNTIVRFSLTSVLLLTAAAWAGEERCGGESCSAVVRGFVAFFDRDLHGLDGNGRSCNDCHMVTERFRLTPAAAEARFQALQKRRQRNPLADDPLFRPVDADDFHINGQRASDYSNLRQNALIRITFTLPANMRLIDPA